MEKSADQICSELVLAVCHLKLLSPNYFSYDQACTFLSSLPLPELVASPQGRLGISSFINFEEMNMVRACGALISLLMEEKVANQDGTFNIATDAVHRDRRTAEVSFGVASRFPVTSMTRIELDGRLHLESNVYDYLQIFHADPHPSALGGAPKEGISLFSFLNRCSSKLGSATLKQWLLAPLSDPSLIEARLDTIDHLWVWVDEELSKQLDFHLRHARDLRRSLALINTDTASCNHWTHLKEACVAALRIRELITTEFSRLVQPPELVSRILKCDEKPLMLVSHLIIETLDVSNPSSDKKPQIRGGVDLELDRLRGIMTDLNGFLDTVAQSELRKYPAVSSLRVVYVPQIGFQIAIPFEERLPVEHPDEPFLQYSSNEMSYYRTKATQELNEMLGDVSPQIRDRRDAVLHSLAKAILPHTRYLIHCTNWMAELDALISMMHVSKENDFVRPTILNPIEAFMDPKSRNGSIRIQGGRHPLLEHVMSKQAKRFVANSTEVSLSTLYTSCSSVQVILGPNGSGKSVYLSQTGLIVFMAHLGCYVPASEAEICVVDHLFTFSSARSSGTRPMRSKESVTSVTATGSGVGSFLNDAHNMGRILRNATPLSLILIDEFGRGTVESDARSLLIASIAQLTAPRPLRTETSDGQKIDATGAPKALISTHLKILHSPTLARLQPPTSFFHMTAIMALETDSSSQFSGLESNSTGPFLAPTFLYQLKPVTSDYQPPQLGVYCAKLAGVEPWVLKRAMDLKHAIFHRSPISTVLQEDLAGNDPHRRESEDRAVDQALSLLEANFGVASLHSMGTVDALTFINRALGPT